jgi:broad specificity phosphatase PhoE
VETLRDLKQKRIAFSPFYYRLPDGESGADVYDRISTFLETLHRDFEKPDFPENALIVTYGMTLRIFLMRWFHWTVEYFERVRNPKNAEVVVMELEEDGRYLLGTPLRLREVEC